MATVDILLATYNGAAYLPDLLKSLEDQRFGDWRLLIRDDGSTDDTLALIQAWADRGDRRVHLIADGRGSLGACGNFAALLSASDAPYFMFCDQDDVWLPEKVGRLVDLMRSVEAQKGPGVAILGHSDLALVDSHLRPIHPSLKRYARIAVPHASSLWRLVLVSNIVTGCASIGNAALRKMALPIPVDAAMHDWWLALVAAAFGEIAYLPESTVLYRQHELNAVGAKSWSLPHLVVRLFTSPRRHFGKAVGRVKGSQAQAAVFAKRYGHLLHPDTCALMAAYGEIRSKRIWERKVFLVKHQLWGRNPVYTAMLLALV